jgi:hypothetical protein
VRAEQGGDPRPGRVPGGLATLPVTALVQREHDPDDLLRGHVVQHGRLGTARLAAVLPVGCRHHGHDDDIGGAQRAHALDGDEFRIAGSDSDPDQPAVAHDVRHLSTNRRATPGSEAQCVCR